MKKLIALTLAALFIGVGVASATDFSLTGSYYARGEYYDNVQAQPIVNSESFAEYDHELSVDATWAIDDTTKVFARFEMRDETWGKNNPVEGSVYNTSTFELDDNIIVEQVWGAHTFGNGHTLTVGKMSSGAWGTTFNDNGSEAYRVKYVAPTAIGTVIGILEKGREMGSITAGEDFDSDTYILGLVTKVADINVKPLFVFVDNQNDGANPETEIIKGVLALDGTFGNIGFEAEGVVQNVDTVGTTTDYTLYGLYGNVWMTVNALKVGILGAYGSYDDDRDVSFDFGDDFEAGGALIMGDDITFDGSGNDLSAGRLIAIYFDYAINEKLSFGGYAGYAKCGVMIIFCGMAQLFLKFLQTLLMPLLRT